MGISHYLILFFCCGVFHRYGENSNHTRPDFDPELTVFDIDCSIRAIHVIDDLTIWFSGSGGKFGYTEDGGKTWDVDSIVHENLALDFRSIAVTDNAVFLLSIASPALLFKSIDHGKTWKLVYSDHHPSIFYDAMAFRDNTNGMAVGDEIDGCLSVIKTGDGGDTWQKITCDNLPSAVEGEGCFAASNSNITVYNHHTWMVTGGPAARVFRSSDGGDSWEVSDTPIIQGGSMTGIFSVDFYDEKTGIIVGGDWNDKESRSRCKAITNDGGKIWQLINNDKAPGYRSCVQYVPHSAGKEIFAVGTPGLSYSSDGGKNWCTFSKESYFSVRLSPSGKVAWLSGLNKIARMTW